MNQNTCNICNKSFSSDQELREHQKSAHGAVKKEQDNPGNEQNQGERKIAS